MSETDGMAVYFTAGIQKTKVPLRFRVLLIADGYNTGISAIVWGANRARKARDFILDQSVEIFNEAGTASDLLQFLKGVRKEKELADVKPGDRVRLAVDIGPFKTGRVCKVTAVNGEGEAKYGISVVPVYSSGDGVEFRDGDSIALDEGEYGPLNEDVGE